VDLVNELPGVDLKNLKRRSGPSVEHLSTFKKMYKDGRKTVHWWAVYKRQTGSWPWFSIAIHFMNWVVSLAGLVFLIWWGDRHHLSRWQFLGMFLLVSLPYLILEEWAKKTVKLNYVRNGRRLAQQRNLR
jgi:hypothetical protein